MFRFLLPLLCVFSASSSAMELVFEGECDMFCYRFGADVGDTYRLAVSLSEPRLEEDGMTDYTKQVVDFHFTLGNLALTKESASSYGFQLDIDPVTYSLRAVAVAAGTSIDRDFPDLLFSIYGYGENIRALSSIAGVCDTPTCSRAAIDQPVLLSPPTMKVSGRSQVTLVQAGI